MLSNYSNQRIPMSFCPSAQKGQNYTSPPLVSANHAVLFVWTKSSLHLFWLPRALSHCYCSHHVILFLPPVVFSNLLFYVSFWFPFFWLTAFHMISVTPFFSVLTLHVTRSLHSPCKILIFVRL